MITGGWEVQILQGLGLTFNQARICLALVYLGLSSAKTISQMSRVTVQDVYRVMPALLSLGIVEKAITKPTMYKALQIENVLPVLLRRKEKEQNELRTKTERLLSKLKNRDPEIIASEAENPQFVLVPPREAAIQKRIMEIETARDSIAVIISWRIFPKTALTFEEVIKKAIRRGVEIRIITEKPTNIDLVPNVIQEFQEIGEFKIRYTTHAPPTIMTIYDKKEALFTTMPSSGFGKSTTLWTSNQSLVTVFQEYFETMWIKAAKLHTLVRLTNAS